MNVMESFNLSVLPSVIRLECATTLSIPSIWLYFLYSLLLYSCKFSSLNAYSSSFMESEKPDTAVMYPWDVLTSSWFVSFLFPTVVPSIILLLESYIFSFLPSNHASNDVPKIPGSLVMMDFPLSSCVPLGAFLLLFSLSYSSNFYLSTISLFSLFSSGFNVMLS